MRLSRYGSSLRRTSRAGRRLLVPPLWRARRLCRPRDREGSLPVRVRAAASACFHGAPSAPFARYRPTCAIGPQPRSPSWTLDTAEIIGPRLSPQGGVGPMGCQRPAAISTRTMPPSTAPGSRWATYPSGHSSRLMARSRAVSRSHELAPRRRALRIIDSSKDGTSPRARTARPLQPSWHHGTGLNLRRERTAMVGDGMVMVPCWALVKRDCTIARSAPA